MHHTATAFSSKAKIHSVNLFIIGLGSALHFSTHENKRINNCSKTMNALIKVQGYAKISSEFSHMKVFCSTFQQRHVCRFRNVQRNTNNKNFTNSVHSTKILVFSLHSFWDNHIILLNFYSPLRFSFLSTVD